MNGFHEVDRASLAWQYSGTGPLIVWCHGLGSSTFGQEKAGFFDWSSLEGSHTLLRYDARGHGLSTGSSEPIDYRWQQLGEDLLSLLGEIAPHEQVIGLGSSMGTATLIYAALAQPKRFSHLVLTSPSTAHQSRPAQARVYQRLADIHDQGGPAEFERTRATAPRPAIFREENSQPQWEVSDSRTTAVLRGAALSDLPPAGRMTGLRVPTLVLAWTTDPAHPIGSARMLANTLREATLTISSSADAVRAWPTFVSEFLSATERISAVSGEGRRTG